MNNGRYCSFLLVLLLIGSGWACSRNTGLAQQESFSAVLKQTGQTSTFQMLVFTGGGTQQVLGYKVKGTLIVPTDAAFNELGGVQLMKLMDAQQSTTQVEWLKKHMISTALSPKQLQNMNTITGLAGNAIPVRSDASGLYFGAAKVQTIWQTPEGMVYIVDKVLP